jgi:ectoine hydroxylase-related dioxygenase (phytanoyl-CoA dioxygenase family)
MINDDDKKFFAENGYLIVRDVFSRTELDAFDQTLRYVIRQNLIKASTPERDASGEVQDGEEFDKGTEILEEINHANIVDLYDSICNTPQFVYLSAKPAMAEIAGRLLGLRPSDSTYMLTQRCRVDLSKETLFTLGWHQEVFYTIPRSAYVMTWIPLVRASSSENGTLEVCLGSHRAGIAPQTWRNVNGFQTQITVDDDDVAKYQRLTVEIERGTVLFFSGKLIHRSGRNTSGTTRFSLVGSYHDISLPDFRPPKFRAEFKGQSQQSYYEEVFGRAVESA